MTTSPVWRTLSLRAGAILLVDPPNGYTKWLRGMKGGIALRLDDVEIQQGPDAIVENAWLFVRDAAALAKAMGDVSRHLDAGTNLVVSAKGDAAMNAQAPAVEAHGWTRATPATMLDDEWWAMRFKRG